MKIDREMGEAIKESCVICIGMPKFMKSWTTAGGRL